MEAQAPYTREETTLREIKNSPEFAKGWYAKIADGEEPFVIPLSMFFSQYSDCDPWMDEEQTAFYNERGDVVLLWTGYNCSPLITLLSSSAALDYLYCSDTLIG